MGKLLKEFKEFAVRGNALDMAVGIIIGGAFGKIVSSLVGDVLMPPIGLIIGRIDFGQLFVSLSGKHFETLAEAKRAGAPTLNYGQFLLNVIDFIIVAFVVFLMVRGVNRLRQPQAETPVVKECPYCCSSIPVRAVRCPHCTAIVEK